LRSLNDALIRRGYDEIDYNKKIVKELIHKFPIEPCNEVLKEIEEFLISIRLEHTYSERCRIKLINSLTWVNGDVMNYIEVENVIKNRFKDREIPTWKYAVICFRDYLGSNTLVDLFQAKPLGQKLLYGLKETEECPYVAVKMACGLGILASLFDRSFFQLKNCSKIELPR